MFNIFVWRNYAVIKQNYLIVRKRFFKDIQSEKVQPNKTPALTKRRNM